MHGKGWLEARIAGLVKRAILQSGIVLCDSHFAKIMKAVVLPRRLLEWKKWSRLEKQGLHGAHLSGNALRPQVKGH